MKIKICAEPPHVGCHGPLRTLPTAIKHSQVVDVFPVLRIPKTVPSGTAIPCLLHQQLN